MSRFPKLQNLIHALRRMQNRIRIHFFESITLLIFSIIMAVHVFPAFAMSLGNIFFGGVKPLYHIEWAQYLYERAAYPILGKAPHYAHHQLSRTYFIKGELNQAISEARIELELYPEDTATYYILGLTYGFMNMEQDAIDAFTAYIDFHPQTWAGRNDKAWLQFRIGDISGALETIQPAAERYPTVPWVQNTYCALLVAAEDLAYAQTVCANAETLVNNMTEDGWGRSFPGNDPRTYGAGLRGIKRSVGDNQRLLGEKLSAEK